MARVGGRNAAVAWFVGLLALGAVGVLVWLALPLVAPGLSWAGSAAGGSAASDGDPGASAAPATTCEQLYPEALWSYLTQTTGGDPVQDDAAPTTTATEFTAAVAPQVRFTCTWQGETGVVSTTVATVGPDAGAIAIAALPALGYTCDSPDGVQAGRVRCSLDTDGGAEEIDLGGGLWVSSSLAGWQPERYASRVADRAFAGTSPAPTSEPAPTSSPAPTP